GAHPAEPEEHGGVGDAGAGREDVAGDRVGCGGEGGLAPEEEERHAEPDRGHEGEVTADDRFLEQPGSQQQDVERRGGLEEDRVGRGGEPVGEHEEHQGGCIRHRHEQRDRQLVPPELTRGGEEEPDRQRRDAGAERRDLPAAESDRLDGGTASGKEKSDAEDFQPRPGPRDHRQPSATTRPSMTTPHTWLVYSKGSPSKSTRSPSFPGSREPTRLDRKSTRL